MDFAAQRAGGSIDQNLYPFDFLFGLPHQCIVKVFLDIAGSDFRFDLDKVGDADNTKQIRSNTCGPGSSGTRWPTTAPAI